MLDGIVGFPIHRGILALGRRAPLPSADDLLAGLGHPALIVMLHGIANHDNVGAIFRNAAAFGADAVLLDGETCDPLYRKAIRVSVGASLIVPFARFDATVLDLLDTARLRRDRPQPVGNHQSCRSGAIRANGDPAWHRRHRPARPDP